MRKVLIFLISLCMCFSVILVQAEESITLSVLYNPEKSSVVLSGKVEGYAMIMIVPAVLDENEEDISLGEVTKDNPPRVMKQINYSGRFSGYEILLPESLASGKYAVYIHSNGKKVADYFFHMNITQAQSVLEILKEHKDNSDLNSYKSTVTENANTLGIDIEDAGYIRCADRIVEFIYNFCDEYESPSAFNAFYHKMYAIAGIEKSDRGEIENILEKKDTNLSIDYNDDYLEDERIDESAKDKLCTLLSETDFLQEFKKRKNTDFASIFEEQKSTAAVATAKTWTDIKMAVTMEFDNLKYLLEKSEYKKVVDKNDVFSKMKSYTIESFEDIEKAFLSAVKKVGSSKAPTSSGGNTGSSSGGSSFGGGGQVIYTPPVVEEKFPLQFKLDFSDFDKEHWAYDAVYSLSSKNIINGYPDKTFRPDNTITRAEFVKIIFAAAEEFGILLAEKEDAEFSDVNEGEWYYECISRCASLGIVKGADGKFMPDKPITREDAAVIIHRYISSKGIISGIKIFDDRRDMSEYAKDPVSSLASVGVINGTGDNKFMPKENITRAQASQLIYKALEYVVYTMEESK